MGGSVAVAAAHADPKLVRGVVIVDSSPAKRYVEGPGARRLAFAPLIGPGLLGLTTDSTVRSGMESAFAQDVEVPDRFVEDTQRVTATAFIESSEGSSDYAKARPLPDRLAATRRPLLVIFGAQDNLVHRTAVRAWKQVPGTEAHVLPDTGHSPNYERPGVTAALIGRFAERTL
jgi:pimeloyl-ACP methyl ester carboxylesterase